MSETTVNIKIVQGKTAPRMKDATKLSLKQVVVTENGTVSNLPVVDFVAVSETGEKFYFSTTGRIACSIAATVRGVNARNHGIPEP